MQRIWQYTVATGGFVLTGLLIWIAAAMLSTGAQAEAALSPAEERRGGRPTPAAPAAS